jgi:hypothetical protein
MTALLGLPVLYVVSFGPACWISERLERGRNCVSTAYRPIIWLGNRSPLGIDIMSQYARFGARPDATPDFTNDHLSWWKHLFRKDMIYFHTTIECDAVTTEDDSSGEGVDDTLAPPARDELSEDHFGELHDSSFSGK